MKQPKNLKLAVFDIDGTVFRSSLLIELIDALVAEGIFPAKAQKEIADDYISWLDRRGTYRDYIVSVTKIYFKYIKNTRVNDIKKIANKMLGVKRNRVYRFTRDLVKYLKKKKYYVLALSASPDYLVESFAKSAGFNQGLGSVYEVKRGIFTGKLLNEHHILNKDLFLRHFMKTSKFKSLKDSIGVGDTESDIGFLQMVSHPIAFNPNRKLADFARKSGWKIVVERKDVIYHIKDFEIEEIE